MWGKQTLNIVVFQFWGANAWQGYERGSLFLPPQSKFQFHLYRVELWQWSKPYPILSLIRQIYNGCTLPGLLSISELDFKLFCNLIIWSHQFLEKFEFAVPLPKPQAKLRSDHNHYHHHHHHHHQNYYHHHHHRQHHHQNYCFHRNQGNVQSTHRKF